MDRLLVVWEFDRGIRSGFVRLADGRHCHFEQVWGETDYLDEVVLKPVSRETVLMAREARELFVAWERRRALGLEDGTTRPDIPGKHPRYWQLAVQIDAALKRAVPLRLRKRLRLPADMPTPSALLPGPGAGDDGDDGVAIRFEDVG